MLSKKALQEFRQIWREEFGEEIPEELAVEEGLNLLTLFDAIFRPLKKEWCE